MRKSAHIKMACWCIEPLNTASDSSDVHIDVMPSNTSEFCAHSKLVMGTQHSSQQSLDISLPVFQKIYYPKMPQTIKCIIWVHGCEECPM